MNNKATLFADVILPLPLQKYYTYTIPAEFVKSASVGKRTIVQFGSKKLYTAVINNVHQRAPDNYKTKEIITILDDRPIVGQLHLLFWEWIAEYYLCTVGDVFKAAVPSGLRLESETKLFIKTIDKELKLNETENLLIEIINDNPGINLQKLLQSLGKPHYVNYIRLLIDKNIVLAEEKLKDTFTPKKETYIELNNKYHSQKTLNEAFEQLKNAPKQTELLMQFLKLSGFSNQQKLIKKQELLQKSQSNSSTLASMVSKNILLQKQVEVSRFFKEPEQLQPPYKLNNIQQAALEDIKRQFNEKQVVLLHGITSSGKTELYIHLIHEQIKKGKQVLYLLPEIALTAQIIIRLKTFFGDKVGIYHSKFGNAERVEIWKDLLNTDSRFKVILGVRSSIFLPFQDLGLVIVDEEHENTYKQFDPAPRYHARDAAIYLAGLHNTNVLLGTATPSVESFFNAKNQKYGFVEITKRYKNIKLPQIYVINLQEAYKKKKMHSHFTPELLDHLKHAFNSNEQAILFQNRRGFAPYLQCTSCEWIPQCPNCDVSLAYHKNLNKLVCHYCSYSIVLPKVCQACGNPSLETRGFGTEKIEDEIKIYFDNVSVERMDTDTTRSRRSYEKIIRDFEEKKTDVLIGTQMISKGLNFDNVSVVGILNADNMLNFPDFRAHERSFDLMTQVSGRAGRSKKQGTVIIQTYDPKHPIIQNVLNNDYYSMYNLQIAERKQFSYPPFVRMIKIIIKHKNKETLNSAALLLANRLRSAFGNRILGPQYPVIGRIQNYYIKHIILKIEKAKPVNKAKEYIFNQINNMNSNPKFKSIIVNLDMDTM